MTTFIAQSWMVTWGAPALSFTTRWAWLTCRLERVMWQLARILSVYHIRNRNRAQRVKARKSICRRTLRTLNCVKLPLGVSISLLSLVLHHHRESPLFSHPGDTFTLFFFTSQSPWILIPTPTLSLLKPLSQSKKRSPLPDVRVLVPERAVRRTHRDTSALVKLYATRLFS